MDDINLNFIDDDFELKEIQLKNPLLDFEENNNVESNDKKKKDVFLDSDKDKKEVGKKNKKKNQKNKKQNDIDNNISNDDLLNDIYSSLEEYSKVVGRVNEKNKELELLRLDYEKVKNENEYLNKKYKSENEAKIKLDIELRRVKSNLIEKEKKVLMLKTLVQLIIREYGAEEIAKVTKLNMDQLKKFLN